MRNLITLW